jgi:tight adherence protein B
MVLLSALAFFLIVFLGGAITLAILWMAFLKMRAELSDAEESDATNTPALRADLDEPLAAASSLLREDRLSTITFWDSLLARLNIGEILKSHLDQAELSWSVGRFTSMMLLIGIVVLAVLLRLVPTWAAVLGALVAAMAPYNYVLRRRNSRFRKFQENFPDVLDSLARALRAGYPLSAAMEMVASEAAPPVSQEIRRTSTEANLGRGWPHALEGLGKRIPLLEVNTFIAAIQLHARTGGKLSEVMTGLAENMREAIALQGEVRALAAHGKLTGLILTILPIGIAVMMMFVSPSYMRTLFQHPWGKNLIGIALACLLLAHFVIRKIVDIRV